LVDVPPSSVPQVKFPEASVSRAVQEVNPVNTISPVAVNVKSSPAERRISPFAAPPADKLIPPSVVSKVMAYPATVPVALRSIAEAEVLVDVKVIAPVPVGSRIKDPVPFGAMVKLSSDNVPIVAAAPPPRFNVVESMAKVAAASIVARPVAERAVSVADC